VKVLLEYKLDVSKHSSCTDQLGFEYKIIRKTKVVRKQPDQSLSTRRVWKRIIGLISETDRLRATEGGRKVRVSGDCGVWERGERRPVSGEAIELVADKRLPVCESMSHW
jgi:hypothetical protein